ncbi:13178_t:CDS:1, partial [Funneliformis geosporum]
DTSIVSEQINISYSNQHLNLIEKALCRKHYNKLIVNARKESKPNKCLHLKHMFYISTTQNSTEEKKLKKTSERLI